MTKKRFFHNEIIKLNIKKEFLRYTTPENIAEYRAKRLKCDIIVDLCCGIGGQTIYFSKYCKKVYAIDKNKKKIKIAKKLSKKLNLKNIQFICSDVFNPKIIPIIKNANIIFMDPERPAFEVERKIESINPSISKIISFYSCVSSNFCIEIPPQINIEKITYNCEKEFISVKNNINRLTIYFGDLKKGDTSAISFPSNNKILSLERPINNIKIINQPMNYIYEIDIVIFYSNLLEHIIKCFNPLLNINNFYLIEINHHELFLTSNIFISNPFIIQKYILLKKIKYDFSKKEKLFLEINLFLKEINSDIVKIRGNIPQNLYFSILKKINMNLKSNLESDIFVYFLKYNVFILKKIH